MLMMTQPSTASQKRQIICGKCQQAGHSPKSKAYHSYSPANEEEALTNKYFLNTILTKGSTCRKNKKIEIFLDLNRAGHDKSVKKKLAF